MKNVKAGSKVTTHAGRSYVAISEPRSMSGSRWINVVATEDNGYVRSLEIRCIAAVAE